MKRSSIQRKSPMARIKPKMRKCKNKACGDQFVPQRPLQTACCTGCAIIIAKDKARAEMDAKAKAERKEDKERKEAAKPLRELLKAAEVAVNLYVRTRDAMDGCISCHKPSHWDGQWHASHFKSVGSNSVLRYNLFNIHKACSECNLFKSGNIVEYEKRLTLKIGPDRVDWLKRQGGVKKYSAEYLIRLKKVFTKKSKRLEKRRG